VASIAIAVLQNNIQRSYDDKINYNLQLSTSKEKLSIHAIK
jgi:hypothetical protein